MYPYHNTNKKRIKNGELVGYSIKKDYPKIGECLVLEFNCPPFLRPIRPHKYFEYTELLTQWNQGLFKGKNQ